jgi:type II secretory pathway pseudopilin PulG
MQPHRPFPTCAFDGAEHPSRRASSDHPDALRHAKRPLCGVTLVELMVSMTLLVVVMLGFLSTFLQSRRLTEGSVLHAAATSLFYGIVEQMKGLSYTELLPSTAVDDDAPVDVKDKPPYIRIRINQDVTKWLRVVYTQDPKAPKGPTSTPSPSVKSADIGAIDNFLGNLPLSTVTGTASQDLALNLWIWIDEITGKDADEVKKVTIVYTYSYMDGGKERVVRNREVFLRTRYDK